MPHYGELFFREDVCKLELRSTSDEGEANETKKVKKNIDLRGNLTVHNFFFLYVYLCLLQSLCSSILSPAQLCAKTHILILLAFILAVFFFNYSMHQHVQNNIAYTSMAPCTGQKNVIRYLIYLHHFLKLMIKIVICYTEHYCFQNFAWYNQEGWSLVP